MFENITVETIEPFNIKIIEPKEDISEPFTVPCNKLMRLVTCLLKENPKRVLFVESVPNSDINAKYKLDSVNQVPMVLESSESFKLISL